MGDVCAQERFPVDQTLSVTSWSRHVSHSRALSWTTTGSLIILWSPSAFGERPSSLSPYRWVNNLHPSNFLGAPARRTAKNHLLVNGSRPLRTPLSRPTSCRSTPITTTGLRFIVRVCAEGAMDLRLVA